MPSQDRFRKNIERNGAPGLNGKEPFRSMPAGELLQPFVSERATGTE